MKNKLLLNILLISGYLLFSAVAVWVQSLLISKGMDLSWKLHLLFFALHLFSLLVVLIMDPLSRSTASRFLILIKIGFMLFIVYKFPEIKQHIFIYFGIYWYYLLVETSLEIIKIRNQDKNHK